jgi:hypothetical protein
MKKLLVITLLNLLNISIASANDDAVLAHGKNLHDDKCMSCHKTKVYTREDRTVKTLDALEKQVNFCMKGAAKAEWTTTETNSVIEYVNNKFYKF